MENLLNQSLKTYRVKIDDLVRQLHDLTVQIGHTELANTVSDLRNRINEPFMFVIVGEVKAGKSSFVNALLGTGKEICKVAPQPMTDTIQQILYGETEEMISFLKPKILTDNRLGISLIIFIQIGAKKLFLFCSKKI